MSPRRRARLIRTFSVAAATLITVGLVVVATTGHSTHPPASGADTVSSRTSRIHAASALHTTHPASTTSAASSTATVSPSPTVRPAPADVFDTAAVASYLAGPGGDITAAVFDKTTGTMSLYRPGVTFTTASIMKVDILETLLAHEQTSDTPLDADDVSLAQSMIEDSDNDSATALWDEDGGPSGVGAYNTGLGLRDTVLNTQGYWGLSTTTALDQVRLVEHVAFPNATLSTVSRDYALNLMENIDPGQNWGVTAGVPAGVTVALKNGWDPINGIWQVNSIGWVNGDGRDYVIAVLDDGHGSEQAGINAIQGLSSLVWTALAPATG